MVFQKNVAYWCLIIDPAGGKLNPLWHSSRFISLYIFWNNCKPMFTYVSGIYFPSYSSTAFSYVHVMFTSHLVICLLKLLTSVMKHMKVRRSEWHKLIISGLLPHLYCAWKILSTHMRESCFNLFLQVWASHEWGNTVNLSDGLLVLPSMETWRAVSPLQGMLFLLRLSHNSELKKARWKRRTQTL